MQALLRKIEPYLYLLPALLLVGGLLLYSVAHTFGHQLYRLGFDYPASFSWACKTTLTPSVILLSPGRSANTLIWTGGSLLLPVAGGLLLAVVLERIPRAARLENADLSARRYCRQPWSPLFWSYVYTNNGVLE